MLPEVVTELIHIMAPATVHQHELFPIEIGNLKSILDCTCSITLFLSICSDSTTKQNLFPFPIGFIP